MTVRFGASLSLFERLRGLIAVDLSAHAELCAAFRAILAEQKDPGPGHGALATALMTQCLVYTLREVAADSAERSLPWLAVLDDPRMARAIDRMLDDPAADHTVGSLAESASMSRSAFAEHFTAAFGRPPMNFLQQVRMQQAANLLQRDATLSVDEVASRVGYASRSHFADAFRKHHGVPPAAFRVRL